MEQVRAVYGCSVEWHRDGKITVTPIQTDPNQSMIELPTNDEGDDEQTINGVNSSTSEASGEGNDERSQRGR